MRPRLLVPSMLLAAMLPCFGQQTTATLVGSVSDSTSAFVPDVTIRATNIATGIVRDTKSDNGGSYSLPFLAAGEYRVAATKEGFQSQQVEHLTLQVQQTARVDFTMQVGNVSETVNVSASAVALQTENSTVGTVID